LSVLEDLGDTAGLLRNLAIVVAIGVIIAFHVGRRRFDPMATAAAVLLVLPAIGGLNAQYLLWPLPFMFLAERLRLAAVYSAVCSLLVLAYCALSALWANPTEETYFFMPIRALRFLAVPNGAEEWLASEPPADVWRFVANLLFPLFAIAIAGLLLSARPLEISERLRDGVVLLRRAIAVNAPVVVVLLVSALVYALGPYQALARRVRVSLLYQMDGYPVSGLPFSPRVDSGSSVLTSIIILPLLVLAWAVVVWWRAREPDRRAA
jgi:hypothetical protein